MAEYTENLNLKKPAQDEQYNVDDFNDNFDKIDDFAGIVPPRALTADKLTTGAKINGVNFKGDTDIITGLGLYSDTNTYNNTNLAYLYDNNSKLRIFHSLQNGNIGHNPLTNSLYWEEIQIGQKRNLGEIVTSSLPITDSSLHLADGSLLSASDYQEFLSYISSIYTPPTVINYYCWNYAGSSYYPSYYYYTTSTTPTIGDDVYDFDVYDGFIIVGEVTNVGSGEITIRTSGTGNIRACTRYSTKDKSESTYSQNYFTSEADWQASVTTYGECGKYVYNSINNTVRLPLYNSYFTNTIDPQKLGNLTPASLPNIKGVIPASEKLYKSGTSVSDYGAFRDYAENVVSGQSDNTHFDNDLWDFDASRSNAIYSDSATTVNTQSIKQLVYIVVKA